MWRIAQISTHSGAVCPQSHPVHGARHSLVHIVLLVSLPLPKGIVGSSAKRAAGLRLWAAGTALRRAAAAAAHDERERAVDGAAVALRRRKRTCGVSSSSSSTSSTVAS